MCLFLYRMGKIVTVVLGIVIDNNEILVIHRAGGGFYDGMLALPGGKLEENEHVSEAAVREVKEEAGIETEFEEYLGFVCEHFISNGEVEKTFLLHIIKLNPESRDIVHSDEGELEWINLDKLEELKDKFVPSDFLILEKMVKNKEKNYYDCVIEKQGDKHILKKFE